jgi:hypothetical protein
LFLVPIYRKHVLNVYLECNAVEPIPTLVKKKKNRRIIPFHYGVGSFINPKDGFVVRAAPNVRAEVKYLKSELDQCDSSPQ